MQNLNRMSSLWWLSILSPTPIPTDKWNSLPFLVHTISSGILSLNLSPVLLRLVSPVYPLLSQTLLVILLIMWFLNIFSPQIQFPPIKGSVPQTTRNYFPSSISNLMVRSQDPMHTIHPNQFLPIILLFVIQCPQTYNPPITDNNALHLFVDFSKLTNPYVLTSHVLLKSLPHMWHHLKRFLLQESILWICDTWEIFSSQANIFTEHSIPQALLPNTYLLYRCQQ